MTSDEHGGSDRLTGAQESADLDVPGVHRNDEADQHGSQGMRGRFGRPPAADGGQEARTEHSGGSDADGAVSTHVGKGRWRSTWRELPVLIVVALAIALVIKTFVVQPFYIPSSSMEDTLLIGDKVLVNKLVYHLRSIQPGDIVVFNGVGSWDTAPPPAKPSSDPFVRAYDATLRPLFRSIADLFGTPVGQTDYIKRVIGVPGDDVACCNAQGLVTVNGVPLHESSYLFPGAAPSELRFNKVVPPGRIWVMGDNRAVSDDSRLRQARPGGGTIPESQVIGRAFMIVWPPSRWRILPIPSTFGQPGVSKPAHAAASGAGMASPGDGTASYHTSGMSGQVTSGTPGQAAMAKAMGVQVRSEAPYAPLAAGLVAGVPLTWLQRRARRWLISRSGAQSGERRT
jgi:signal peptidase I